MSSKWIDSLFDSDTSRLSPLDFRLIAAAQFRQLKAMCTVAAEGVDLFRGLLIGYSMTNRKTMSREMINSQMATAVSTFNVFIQTSLLSDRGPQFLIMFPRLRGAISAVRTNAFYLSISDSDQYQYESINNFYPLYDNASYDNVSYFDIVSQFLNFCID